jgi:CRP/FNR family cyclic AMP-dependent transcriptional regulator
VTIESLRAVPIFGSLDDHAAHELRKLISLQTYKAGTRLFAKGDRGDSMYLIESGKVRISFHDQDANLVVLAELGEGDFFGEMALIDGRNRSANADVIGDARLAVLQREAFVTFVRDNPDVAMEMLAALSERIRRTDELLRGRASRNANDEEAARSTLADRAADVIANFGGSWKFILTFVGLIVSWMTLNTLAHSRAFDPVPFNFLNLVLAIVAGMQAPIIMMSQNRQGEKDRLRADLDYQVNLKNELALAEVLHRLEVLENERIPDLIKELKADLK